MILIIAEKPSLGRNIAAAIGGMVRRDGFLEGKEYLVTWAFGHLFSLCDIEEYTGGTGKWSMENLPCFPEHFRFTLRKGADKQVDPGVKKQFEIIRSLCAREDVTQIVNAGDADREGEIIVRLCIQHTGIEKEEVRLWLPDQTPQTVQKALTEMKSEREYDLLASEGFARTYIDWLYGVNLTRYATLKTGTLLRVGRVIIPIVKAVYDRDMAIRNFQPEIFYAPVSRCETNGEEIELVSRERFKRAEDCRELCRKMNEAGAVVTSVKRKKDTVNPGKLFSLSKLQNFLGKKYKMPMEQSLSTVQKLYESGYVTYPRTNSEYLATAEKEKIRKILDVVAGRGYKVTFKDKKTIFDDSKIESHSALTPTYQIPDKARLSETEQIVYTAIMRRFAAVFCAEECLAEKTEIMIRCGEEDFRLRGNVILQKGWMLYDDSGLKDRILPRLQKGDAVNVVFSEAEKETSPPKHYTIETLNNYLKNPFREEKAASDEENDDEDYRAIFEGLELGTEATRTGIIDNAVKSEYIALKKDVYSILPKGEYLIESLMQMHISMDKYKTSQMGRVLKKIYHGAMTVEQGIDEARKEIAEVFCRTAQPPETDTDTGFYGDSAGKCPLCGSEVLRSRYGYLCSGYKEKGCPFRIRGTICKRVISLANARQLLSEGRTAKLKGFVSKAGKSFDASLVLENGQVKFDFQATNSSHGISS